MTRRRTGRRPLQRAAVAPRVVHGHARCGAGGDVDVEDEGQHRDTEDHRTDGGQLVHPGEAVLRLVGRVATRHSHNPEPMLHEEGGVETDEQQPEIDLAETLVFLWLVVVIQPTRMLPLRRADGETARTVAGNVVDVGGVWGSVLVI